MNNFFVNFKKGSVFFSKMKVSIFLFIMKISNIFIIIFCYSFRFFIDGILEFFCRIFIF